MALTTLGLMKVAVATGAGSGFVAGAARYVQLRYCSDDFKEEDEDEEDDAEDAEKKLQKLIKRWKKEDDMDMSVMRVMLRAMAGSGALVILGAAPVSVYALGATWGKVWTVVGDSLFLFLPVGLMLSVGADYVASNLPAFFMGMTISSSVLTMIGVPIQLLLGVSPEHVNVYLTGLRIGVSGASGLMIAMFCNRYARLQKRKRLNEDCTEWLESCNNGVIIFARVVGHCVSGAWLYSVYSSAMPYILLEATSITYMYSLQVHLMVPSADHDVRAEINILRNIFLGLHALTVIAQVSATAHPTLASLQRLFAFSTNAAFFGTFNGEWTELTFYEGGSSAERLEGEEDPLASSYMPRPLASMTSGLQKGMADIAIGSNTLGVGAAQKLSARGDEGKDKEAPDAPEVADAAE